MMQNGFMITSQMEQKLLYSNIPIIKIGISVYAEISVFFSGKPWTLKKISYNIKLAYK